jgi:hypothetical protein
MVIVDVISHIPGTTGIPSAHAAGAANIIESNKKQVLVVMCFPFR